MKSKLILSLALLTCIPALAQTAEEMDAYRRIDIEAFEDSKTCDKLFNPDYSWTEYNRCKAAALNKVLGHFSSIVKPITDKGEAEPHVVVKIKALGAYGKAINAQFKNIPPLENERKDSYSRRQFDALMKVEEAWDNYRSKPSL